jgi:hypothetical protein
VTIYGTGLAAATAVTFGDTPATSMTILSPGVITAVAPAGTGAVTVTVTTPNGNATAPAFAYLSPPVVTALSTSQAGAGALITITGTGLSAVSAVHFGTIAASSIFAVSDTTLKVAVPVGFGAGEVSVSVSCPGGVAPVGVTACGTSATGPATEFTFDDVAGCDGALDAADALAILRLSANLSGGATAPCTGDENGDGSVDPRDALLVLRFIAGVTP